MESKHWHLPALSSGKSRGNLGSDLKGGGGRGGEKKRKREEEEGRRGRTMDEEGWKKERDGKRKERGEGSMSDHHYFVVTQNRAEMDEHVNILIKKYHVR